MNFSGLQDNKAFTTGLGAAAPYYYINAHLDLAGTTPGEAGTDPYIFYFNKENNFNYLNRALYPNPDNYGGFYLIGPNQVIGEVTVYSNPDFVYDYTANLDFNIGGVYRPSIALDQSLSAGDRLLSQSMDIWGGPTGQTSGPISVLQTQHAQICYYGQEPADPQPNPANDADLLFGSRQYLAVKYDALPPIGSREIVDRRMRPRKFNWAAAKGARPIYRTVAEPSVEAGSLHVVVKVYNKANY